MPADNTAAGTSMAKMAFRRLRTGRLFGLVAGGGGMGEHDGEEDQHDTPPILIRTCMNATNGAAISM